MNKLLLLLLVVCFVAVRGHVRRDVPQSPEQANNFLQESLNSFQKFMTENTKDLLDPEKIKNVINKGIEDIKKTAETFSLEHQGQNPTQGPQH